MEVETDRWEDIFLYSQRDVHFHVRESEGQWSRKAGRIGALKSSRPDRPPFPARRRRASGPVFLPGSIHAPLPGTGSQILL